MGSRWKFLSRHVAWCFKGDFSKLTGTVLLGTDNDAAARGDVGRWVGGGSEMQVKAMALWTRQVVEETERSKRMGCCRGRVDGTW